MLQVLLCSMTNNHEGNVTFIQLSKMQMLIQLSLKGWYLALKNLRILILNKLDPLLIWFGTCLGTDPFHKVSSLITSNYPIVMLKLWNTATSTQFSFFLCSDLQFIV